MFYCCLNFFFFFFIFLLLIITQSFKYGCWSFDDGDGGTEDGYSDDGLFNDGYYDDDEVSDDGRQTIQHQKKKSKVIAILERHILQANEAKEKLTELVAWREAFTPEEMAAWTETDQAKEQQKVDLWEGQEREGFFAQGTKLMLMGNISSKEEEKILEEILEKESQKQKEKIRMEKRIRDNERKSWLQERVKKKQKKKKKTPMSRVAISSTGYSRSPFNLLKSRHKRRYSLPSPVTSSEPSITLSSSSSTLSVNKKELCPLCKKGFKIIKEKKHRGKKQNPTEERKKIQFFACSNFPTTGCRWTKSLNRVITVQGKTYMQPKPRSMVAALKGFFFGGGGG